jgi:hypothetical protein
MDRLTAELRSLAAEDAATTDPSPAAVERGWTRLCGALAVPIAAPVGAAAAKTIAGLLAVLVVGVSVAAAPTVIEPEPLRVEPIAAAAPRALAPAAPPDVQPLAAAPPPLPAPAPKPTPDAVSSRSRVAPDPLVAELRALATARAHLDAGRHRQALAAARKLLRSGHGQLGPEAHAIEAVAACELGLPRAAELANRYVQRHATSPHRKRVAAACKH